MANKITVACFIVCLIGTVVGFVRADWFMVAIGILGMIVDVLDIEVVKK